MPFLKPLSRLKLIKFISLTIISLPVLAACVGTSQVITGKPLTPTKPANIKIYNDPPPSFKEIARIEAAKVELTNENNKKTPEQLIEELKAVAASLGANAILIRTLSENTSKNKNSYGLSSSYGTAQKPTNNDNQSQNINTLHGVAIYVLEQE